MVDSDDRRDPMARCPHCRRAGLVGSARVFSGEKAGTMFMCHNCQHSWQIPDERADHSQVPPKA
jgi:RNase P subunit RPR2